MTISSRIRVALAVMAAVLLSARPVYAEDIEIYLISNENAGGANVLLLIDNSGGTNRNFPGTQYSEGGKTIDEISFALKQVLGGLAGATRLGVSSQLAGGDDGGAINYPVKQIDEVIKPVGYSRVRSPQGDAFQYMSVPSVPMDVDDPLVSWKAFPNLADSPDADNDNMLMPLPSILSTGGLENVVGFQFPELAVPRFAEVDRAVVTLRSPSPNSPSANSFAVRVAYELSGSPEPFSAGADFPARKWSAPFDNGGASYNAKGSLDNGLITIDVTEVIQHLVAANSFWCGGQTVSLLIQGTDIPVANVPEIYSFRAEDAGGNRLGVSELNVDWDSSGKVVDGTFEGDDALSCMGGLIVSLGSNNDDGTETTDGNNLTTDGNQLVLEKVTSGPSAKRGTYIAGARFAGLGFPMGTKVQSAILRGRFTAVSGASPKIQVAGMLGDTPEFAANGDISSRPLTPTKVEKVAAVGDFTMDVTSVLNEVFNDGSWAAGRSLGLRIDRVGGTSISLHALDNGGASSLSLLMNVLAEDPSAFVGSFSRRTDMGIAIDKFSDSTGGGKNKPASAYVEAARYMLGQTAQYAPLPISHPDAFLDAAGSRYVSPTEVYDECGGNHIIMVTHAESAGESFKAEVDALVGNNNCPSDGNADAWTCSAEVAAFLADASRNPLKVPVVTHTIAFAPQKEETVEGLKAIKEASGGEFRDAEDALELAEALSGLINALTTTDASMAAPGVAVNQLNRFRHLDQLYYALFRPSFNTRWDGNLKRYRLDFDTQQIVDENNKPAVDRNTGFFKDSANSWWGTLVDGTDPDDGRNIQAGGARSELSERGARKLLVSTSSPAPSGGIGDTSAPAGDSLAQIVTTADLTAGAMGAPGPLTAKEMEDRLLFLQEGWGDPLHTEPRLINYGFSGTAEEAAQDDDKQDNTIFVSTNDGMLHAINPKTGEELFSFMPREELKRTEERYLSSIRDKKAPPQLDGADPQRNTYGLDGGITVWRRSKSDGSGEPEHVFLYLSQRRGGNAYYALNVTDRDSPTLMWRIEGGVAPFSKLGQTWSQPTLAQIMLEGQRVPVLIFGGGYSPADHDTAGVVSSGDSVGNALYIVNAYNGKLIWSVSDSGAMESHGDMKWGISSSPSVVDFNFDGVTDYIYVADTGGQVFRIDLNDVNTGVADFAKRIVTLAQLGTSDAAGIANHRRFHASPVVALSRREGGEPFLQVALGSGYRAHPLNMDTADRIFMIDDYDVLQDTSSTPITAADMVDVTTNLSPDPALFEGKRGWLIRLEKGEKVLSAGVVSSGILFISTYLPESAFVTKCQRVVGSSRLYAMGLLDGAPALDLNNDGSVDRSIDLVLPGLPPSPQLLLDGAGNQVLLIGTQALSGGEVGGGKGVRKTRWFEVQTQTEADKELEDAMLGQ